MKKLKDVRKKLFDNFNKIMYLIVLLLSIFVIIDLSVVKLRVSAKKYW